MNLDDKSVAPLRALVSRLCPTGAFEIEGIEAYSGPNPYLPAAATICFLRCREPPSPEKTEEIRRTVSELLEVSLPMPASGGSAGSAAAVGEMIASAFAIIVRVELGLDLRAVAVAKAEELVAIAIEEIPLVPQLLGLAVATEAVLQATFCERLEAPRDLPLLRRVLRNRQLNNESRMLISVARRRGAAVQQVGRNPAVWRVGTGSRADIFWVTSSNRDGMVAHGLSTDKHLSKQLFVQLGLPTPRWCRLREPDDLPIAIARVGWPCVLKPVDRGSGKGVHADIRSPAALRGAISSARHYSAKLMLEAHEPGHDYRLMVIDGRLEMAVRRDPPVVEGDGTSTIRALVAALNAKRCGGPGNPASLYPVPQDEGFELALATQNYTAETIVPAGTRVTLRTNANHSTGGTCANVLDQVHPSVARSAELLARGFGLRVAGVDYITPDISRPHAEVGGGFIEINATPGVEVLITSNVVDAKTADTVVGPEIGDIPITLVLAPTTDCACITEDWADRLSPGVGLCRPGFAKIGNYEIPLAPADPGRCVAMLLCYPNLTDLVVIWSADELMAQGLPSEAIDKVIVVATDLHKTWVELLDRHCNQIVHAASVKDVRAILAGTIGRRQASAR